LLSLKFVGEKLKQDCEFIESQIINNEFLDKLDKKIKTDDPY
jgi:hypothetical protein